MSLATTEAGPSRIALPPEVVRVLLRLAAVLIVAVALSLMSGAFFTVVNIVNVLRQAALLFFLASGLTLVGITAGLDLSVGSTIGLAACVAGTAIKSSGDPWLGVAAALAVGGAVGLLNGLMVSLLRIPSFIATMACSGSCKASPTRSWPAPPSTAFPKASANSAMAISSAFRSPCS
jgi:ribose transport system permease protein